MFHAAAHGDDKLVVAAYFRSDLMTPALFTADVSSGSSLPDGWEQREGPDFHDSVTVGDEIMVVGEPRCRPSSSSTALGLEVKGTFDRLESGSYMCVPLTARGKTFGAMVFLAARDKRYSREDLMLGPEFARRAALAIDNARLYEQAQIAIRMREGILAVVTMTFVARSAPFRWARIGRSPSTARGQATRRPRRTQR